MRSTFVCLLLLITVGGHAQTIRRVNNTGATGVNVYATLQAAHDAAAANDIVIVEPSAVTYGSLTLTKPLKIYGNGYLLETNSELKADDRSSSVDALNFNTGSGGSAVYGLSTASNWNIYGVSNITIQRNLMSSLLITTYNQASTVSTAVSNIVITGNYLSAHIGMQVNNAAISNVIISNNVVAYVNAPDVTYVQGWVVRHNNITSQLSTGTNVTLANSVFENNLLLSGGTPGFYNCSVSYNVSNAASFSGGVGNQNNFSFTGQFVSAGTGISTDELHQIVAGSPLKTAGSAGSEVGIFGGATPYVISGIPAIPSVTAMTTTATGSNSVPLQVTISVKSNN